MISRSSLFCALSFGLTAIIILPGCKSSRDGAPLTDARPSLDSGSVTPDAPSAPDAPDAQVDAAMGIDADESLMFGYKTSNFDPVGLEPPGDVLLDCASPSFDSSSKGFPDWCNNGLPLVVEPDPGGDPASPVILVTRNFEIMESSTLTITGTRPVIFAVFGTATIDGTLDVSATDMQAGPGGSLSTTCGVPGTGGTGGIGGGMIMSSLDGGGGGGGGFGSDGGRGGVAGGGDSNDNDDGGMGGQNGVEIGAPQLIPLRGGCSGGQGGPGFEPVFTGGVGGRGGGAVQISATRDIFIDGIIAAAGSGGKGGSLRDGGGGGGSGGGILLEAASVHLMVDARVTANGGGGGEGGSFFGNTPESDGAGGSKNSAAPAAGGSGPSVSGGDGGDGASGSDLPGVGRAGQTRNNEPADAGGGGGGGGVGRIHINAASCILAGEAAVSPPASTNLPMTCEPPNDM